ncbi:MAG TPA: alpha-galactosidase [Marinobacterium sp.]|nr:alpha-galactosidase [Marinobacterium sp.]
MRFERFDNQFQSLIFSLSQNGLPCCLYWGHRLPENEDLNQLFLATQSDVNGGMLDEVPPISVAPMVHESFPGQAGIRVRGTDNTTLEPNFKLTEADRSISSCQWSFQDTGLGLEYKLQIDHSGPSIILQAHLRSEDPIYVDWLAAPVMPIPAATDNLVEFSGRWCGEFQMNSIPWQPGARLRESTLGRTSHEHFPGLILPLKGCTEDSGDALAMHYAWSGGHKLITEQLPDGRRQVQWGNASDHKPKLTNNYHTAKLYLACSAEGMNGIAEQFQQTVLQRVVSFPDQLRPRPVHYNCWEAVYFDHKTAELVDIAERAARLGAERFVLDDGWFIGRNDDTTSLGDWYVDAIKYPQGLAPLIDKVHEFGMSFGLWFEPEMINTNSELYRAHPEWVLGTKDQILGRNQMVLDLSIDEVRNYLLERLDALLSDYAVDYIKWDHNRVLPYPDSQQAHAFYALLDELRDLHPNVEIESCSSGGGRIDYGVLSRTHRVWLSDSNDALERFWMQRNAALFLPAAVTGSHVGPRACHTSGRELPIEFRAWVAATRHMGFEMDPRELTDHEASVLSEVTAWYKLNRTWMHSGSIRRIESDDDAVLAEMHIAKEKNRFVAFVAQMKVSAQSLPLPVRMAGLDPDSRYRITLVNSNQVHGISRCPVPLTRGDLELSGKALMSVGLHLPNSFPATIWVLQGEIL